MRAESEPAATAPLSRRCPRLGGPVTFGYCMGCEPAGPCPKVIDCWWETFDIIGYLQDHLTADQFHAVIGAQPKPKIAALVELIEKVRKEGKS